jgi:hypothetical protein
MKNSNRPLYQVTLSEALAVLMNVKGHPFQGIELLTEANLSGGKKTLALFGGTVYKYARYVFAVNRGYDRAIEIASEKLGLNFENWQPQPHNYATHVQGNILLHNADFEIEETQKRYYAQFLLHKGCQIESEYFDAEFRPIDVETLKPFFVTKSSPKQTNFGLSDADKVPVINPSLKSIKRFATNGADYEIIEQE